MPRFPRFGNGCRLVLVLLAVAGSAAAQQVPVNVLNAAESTVQVEKGKTALLQFPLDLTQISVGDSTIANITALDPRQLMINGFQIGATTLIAWQAGVPHLYNIEVTADATALQTQLRTLFPGADILRAQVATR